MLLFQSVGHIETRQLPLSSDLVPCGFPFPAQSYVEKHINLNDLLVQHPNVIYFVKSSGDSMTGAGIGAGDLLVVDSVRKAAYGDIMIAAIEDEFTVKHPQLYLVAILKLENSAYAPVMTGNEDTLDIFGVVTLIIKSTG